MAKNVKGTAVATVEEPKRDRIRDIRSITGLSPTLIWADFKKNFSRFRAKSQLTELDDVIIKLAVNMADSQIGNREAVTVERLKPYKEADANGGPYEFDLVTGFNRWTAGMAIVKGFTYVDGEGVEQKIHNPDFTLKVQLFDGSSKDRVRLNLIENTMKRDLTGMDKASMLQYCINILNLSHKEAAEWCGINTPSYVGELLKLLSLPEEIQEMLASGDCPAGERTLMKLMEISPDDRVPFLEKIMGGKKVTLDDVKRHIINRQDDEIEDDESESDDNDEKPKTNSKKPTHTKQQLSPAMMRKFYEARMTPSEFPPVMKYATYMVKKRLPGAQGGSDDQHDREIYKMIEASAKYFFEHLVAEELTSATSADFKDLWKATIKAATPVEVG